MSVAFIVREFSFAIKSTLERMEIALFVDIIANIFEEGAFARTGFPGKKNRFPGFSQQLPCALKFGVVEIDIGGVVVHE